MKVLKTKSFANGNVHLLETDNGFKVETTDTFLPYYTKSAQEYGCNNLQNTDIGSRLERFMIGVSVMSGCPIRCKFCATGQMGKYYNLTAAEIIQQIEFVLNQNPDIDPTDSKEFKINFTRMGEPFLNLVAVKSAILYVQKMYPNVHCYVSTMGIKDADYSWVKDNITLQLSVHSLRDETRNILIPYKNKATLEELGKIRTSSNLKTTINLTLTDEKDFDINRLKELFDPKYFFIKVSPLNKNETSDKNGLNGIIETDNII